MRRAALLLLALALACGEPEDEGLVVPAVGADYVIYGSALAGRTVVPGSVRVARASELGRVRPENIGGGEVDMFLAGLSPDDLPEGVDPLTLRFTTAGDPAGRRMPSMRSPHVLEDPLPPGSRNRLVPIADPSVAVTFQEDRQERFAGLLRGVALVDPCEPLTALTVSTPRTSADAVTVIRTLASGDQLFGFVATSTVFLARLPRGSGELAQFGANTSTAVEIQPGERVETTDLGDQELPGEARFNALVVNFIAGAGNVVGQFSLWDPARRRYVDAMPRGPIDGASAPPGPLYGARHIQLDGAPALCMFGGALGPNQVGAIWCRPPAGGRWSTALEAGGTFAIAALLEDAGGAYAVDRFGTVYRAERAAFRARVRATINEGCDTPCARFVGVAAPKTPGALLGAAFGTKAQVLAVSAPGGEPSLDPLPLSRALFADEREGDHALMLQAATFAPDGSLWIGAADPLLFKLDAGLERAHRVCLPPEARGAQITALEAAPDGRLLVGFGPALLGLGRW